MGELRALRDLATEAFALNSLNLEAAELRDKLAELNRPDDAEGIVAYAEGLSAGPTDAPAPDTPTAMREPPTVHEAPKVEADEDEQMTMSEAETVQPAAQLDASAFPDASPEAAEKLAEVHNVDELGAGTVEIVESMSASGQESEIAEPATPEVGTEESSAPDPSSGTFDGANIEAAEATRNGALSDQAATSSSGHGQPMLPVPAPDTSHAARPAALSDAAPAHAGSGSEDEEAAPQLQLLAGGVNLPHPAKEDRGGEDAFFVSDAHGGAAGVADGVSAWANEGINAALYSRCGFTALGGSLYSPPVIMNASSTGI